MGFKWLNNEYDIGECTPFDHGGVLWAKRLHQVKAKVLIMLFM
jgi:hypothetical protein